MPDGPKYLSTDPAAGLDTGATKYLSTDPHAAIIDAPAADKTLAGFGSNLLTSGGKFVANTAQGLFSTAKTIAKNAQAMNLPTPENIMTAADDPGNQGVAHLALHPLETAGRVVTYAKDRYGSPGKIANTLYTDPVGALVDASTVASLGGGALTKAGQLANLPAVARAGQVVSALDPVAATGKAISRVPVRDLSEATAERLSDSALKVKDTLRNANPGQNIPLDAAREGAVASRAGLRNLNTRLDALSGEVNQAVDASPAVISPWAASQEARDLLRDRRALQQAAPRDPAIMQRTIRNFVGTGNPIPARPAQDMKELFGTKLTNTFGEPVIGAEAETQQALRSGLRRELEQQVPGVVRPNAQMTTLIPVRNAVQDAVNRSQRWDIGQIVKTSGGAGLGAALGYGAGHPDLGALAGATLMRVLENPAVKSRLATATLRAGEAAPAIGGGLQALAPWLTRWALLQQMGNDTTIRPQP